MPTVQKLGNVRSLFLCTALSLFACGAPEPPLEQLELRDALLADPSVIAGLAPEALQQLAGRFWTALGTPDAVATAAAEAGTPQLRLRHLDTQRRQRGQDAFLAGLWAQEAATQTLTPLAPPVRLAPSAPLPALLGAKSTLTQAQEARALAGRAGAVIEALRVRSGALYLERVTSWPAAAVALEDRVYVNATWLTAMAALESGAPAVSNPSSGTLTSTGAAAVHTAGVTAGNGADEEATRATTLTQPRALDPGTLDPETVATTENNASGGFGSCSSCNSSSCNSCNSNSSSSSSSCDNDVCVSSEDKQCCRACAISPQRRTPDFAALWMTLWLGAPLLLLAGVDLWTRVARRRAKA